MCSGKGRAAAHYPRVIITVARHGCMDEQSPAGAVRACESERSAPSIKDPRRNSRGRLVPPEGLDVFPAQTCGRTVRIHTPQIAASSRPAVKKTHEQYPCCSAANRAHSLYRLRPVIRSIERAREVDCIIRVRSRHNISAPY
jgi:hypothetical protein